MKLTRNEIEVMDVFWRMGDATVRDIREALPSSRRPAYTTVQTVIHRLEEKGALRRIGKEGNAHRFKPVVSRPKAYQRLTRELVAIVGSAQGVVSSMVESGDLTLDDLRALEEELTQREDSK